MWLIKYYVFLMAMKKTTEADIYVLDFERSRQMMDCKVNFSKQSCSVKKYSLMNYSEK